MNDRPEQSLDTATADVVAVPLRRCHGTAMPAGVCPGDGLIAFSAKAAAPDAAGQHLQPGADWVLQGWSATGLLDPPRAG